MADTSRKTKRPSVIKKGAIVCIDAEPWIQRRAKDLGFTSTALTACSLPLRRQKNKETGELITEYRRKNGDFTLTIKADREHGLPFGKDRLLFYWVFTEAIKTKSREIFFKSFNEVLAKLDLPDSGVNHKWLKNATTRFLHTAVSFCSDTASAFSGASFTIFDATHLNKEDTSNLRNPNYFRLSSSVFDQLIKHSASLDLEIIRRLSKNEKYGVMDFYCWWIWRAARLEKEHIEFITLPASSLKEQFGVSDTLPMKEFKRLLKEWIRDLELVILSVYGKSTRLVLDGDKLSIYASIPHKLPEPSKALPSPRKQNPVQDDSFSEPEPKTLPPSDFRSSFRKKKGPDLTMRSFEGSFTDMKEIFTRHFTTKKEQWSEITRQLGDAADSLDQEEAKWMAGIQRWFRTAWEKGEIQP